MSHNIWPAGVDFNPFDYEHITIKVGERCNCWRRVDFDIQCKHELKLSCKLRRNTGVIDGTIEGNIMLNFLKCTPLAPKLM